MAGRYKIYRGDVLLGTVVEERPEFPWTVGSFVPTPHFEEVRPLFDEEMRLLQQKNYGAWHLAWAKIAEPGLRLEPLDIDDVMITNFLIHIVGNRFSLRY
jgi:hypothetical protein